MDGTATDPRARVLAIGILLAMVGLSVVAALSFVLSGYTWA